MRSNVKVCEMSFGLRFVRNVLGSSLVVRLGESTRSLIYANVIIKWLKSNGLQLWLLRLASLGWCQESGVGWVCIAYLICSRSLRNNNRGVNFALVVFGQAAISYIWGQMVILCANSHVISCIRHIIRNEYICYYFIIFMDEWEPVHGTLYKSYMMLSLQSLKHYSEFRVGICKKTKQIPSKPSWKNPVPSPYLILQTISYQANISNRSCRTFAGLP